MVKTPKTRHSKPLKEPVTIELEPDAVSRVSDPEKSAAESAGIFEGRESPDTTSEAFGDAASSDPAPDPAADRFIGSEWPPEQEDTATHAKPAAAGSAGQTQADSEGRAEYGAEYGAKYGESTARESMETRSTVENATQKDQRRGGSPIVAGLAGGALVLLGVAGLQLGGFWPGAAGSSSDGSAVAALEADVAALKQELAALKTAPGTDLSVLEKALSDGNVRLDGLVASFDAMKSDVATLQAAVQAGGAGDGAALETLNSKIADIERQLASLGQGGAPAPAELADLTGKIAALESAIGSANALSASNDGRLAAVEQRIGELGSRLDALGDQPKVAMTLAAGALRAALDRGGPFTAEVETLAALAPSLPELTELRALAVEGVSSRQQLIGEVGAAADAMIVAGRVTDENAGFFARLWSSAESLVTVRPIGAVEGEGVPETVARMEQAVKDGDLAKAMAEFETLPDAAKAAGATFADKVKARLAAVKLVDSALAGALKAA